MGNFDTEFGLPVQKKFLQLLIFDQKWAALSGLDIVKPEFFENRILHNICKWIHEYYKKYKNIPTKLILEEKAKDFVNENTLGAKEYFQYSDVFNEIFTLDDNEDLEYFKEKAITFVRQAAWKQVLMTGTETLREGNYEDAINAFKKVLTLGTENDLGLDFNDTTTEKFLDLLKEDYDKGSMLQTGIPGWDKALGGGFVRKNLHLIGAAPGGGKQVATTTLVLTPNGWKKAGEIKVGDYLISRRGTPTKVLGVYPQGISNNYKLTFNDKSVTNCGKEHLWSVYDTSSRDSKELKTLSLEQILEKGLFKSYSKKRKESGRKPAVRWKLPLVEPVQFTKKQYIISPYNLGALLGDGCFCKDSIALSCSSKSQEIVKKFKENLPGDLMLVLHKQQENQCPQYIIQPKIARATNSYKKEILRLNLVSTRSATKFIPQEYKFGSVEQRLELLRGLMDTDGNSSKGCKISYATISKQLAEDVVELVQSLGGLAHINLKTRKPRASHNFKDESYYNVIIKLNLNPFHILYKSANWHPTIISRYITNVEQQVDTDSVCFKVDNEEELFVLEHYIVTHNSKTMAYLTKQALETFKKVIFITLELSETETQANINCAITGLNMYQMLEPENRTEFEHKLAVFKANFNPQCIVKFYKPGCITADTIHNFIQKVIQHKEETLGMTWKPDVIFVDYLDKLLPTQKVKGNIYEDVGGVATDLKNLGITFDCPVISGSQLGRYTWSIKGDQVVNMDAIAESAQKIHLCHSLTTLNANPAEKEQGKVRLFLAKSRSGIPGSVVWCNNDLGRCKVSETEAWDPNTMITSTTFTIKDAANSSNKK